MEGTFGPNHERQERIATALRRIEGGSCHLMGVLNVTPDSFHKASRLATVEEAIASGLAMWRDGATWLDVGGESTRPGAEPVNPEQERQRVLPVIKGLREANPEGMISIDTRRPSVARAALEAGADMINDVSGLRDPEMVNLVLEASCEIGRAHV